MTTILVIARYFPSRIQPWLLNQIEQIDRHGGSVWIVADTRVDETYPAKVDELGLLERTRYHPVGPPTRVLRDIATYLFPFGERGRAARKGLRRILASPWRPGGTKEWVKALVRAPAFDLPGIDLAHAHSLLHGYEYLPLTKVRGVPMVLTFHGLPPKGVGIPSRGKCEALFDGLSVALVNTEFARSQLERLGCPREKIEILPQGIRLSEHPYQPQAFPKHGPVRMLTVGRLQPDKGIAFAIRGVHALVDRGYDVDYTIVGGGPEEPELRALVDELGLGSRVHLTGRIDDAGLREQYRRAHIFVLPSLSNPLDDHTETQGVVIQEAQASGVIVTASRAGGIPECVDDGRSAFLFPDRDPEAIAATVGSVIDRPEQWPEWQSAARRWVEERFDIDRLGDRLWSLYAKLLAHRGATPAPAPD